MELAVVEERDVPCRDGPSVEGDRPHAAAPALMIVDVDLVARGAETPGHAEAGPRRRNARIDFERVTMAAEPEDALEPRAIEPAGCARVPAPARAAAMQRIRIHITRKRVRLRLVALERRTDAR